MMPFHYYNYLFGRAPVHRKHWKTLHCTRSGLLLHMALFMKSFFSVVCTIIAAIHSPQIVVFVSEKLSPAMRP